MALNRWSAPVGDGSARYRSSDDARADDRRPRRAAPSVVSMHGEHDRSTSDGLVAMLAEAVALDDVDLVVDLRDVSFMDASTLGVLVWLDGALREQRRVLTLRSPSRTACRVLDVCGLNELIEVPGGASPMLVDKVS